MTAFLVTYLQLHDKNMKVEVKVVYIMEWKIKNIKKWRYKSGGSFYKGMNNAKC
jgi:hypothetical protein